MPENPPPLATLSDLTRRLGRPLDDTAETALAEAALDDVSALVRHYGLPWTAENAPPIVRRVVLRAAERVVRNPDNYRMEMEGSRQVSLPSAMPISGALTEDEVALIREAAGTTGVLSLALRRPVWIPGDGTVFVPTSDGGEPFPYFAESDL